MGSVAEDVLEHAGVKGMKWGVRKDKRSSGENSRDFGNIKNLSDDDLKKLVTRMRLEQDFKNLTKKPMSEGKKFRKELMRSAGKTLFGIAVSATVGKALKEALEGNKKVPGTSKKKKPKLTPPGASFT